MDSDDDDEIHPIGNEDDDEQKDDAMEQVKYNNQITNVY